MDAFVRLCSGMRSVCAQRVASPFDLNDEGVVEKPVEECGGDDGIAEVFSPGIWWIGFKMNLSGSDVQILQMYS